MFNNTREQIKQFIYRYTINSSIHGVKYLLNKRVNIYGRIIWFIFVFMGILGLFGIIYESIILKQNSERFQLKNIMETPLYSVHRISFPSVTVCNYNRINWQRINMTIEKFIPNETDEFQNLFIQYLILHESSEYIQTKTDYINFFKLINNKNDLYKLNKINFTYVFDYLTFKCDEIFVNCWWRVRNITCCSYFHKLKTLNGFCWAFNSIYHRDMFLYKNPEPLYPWRVAQGGKKSALYIKLKLDNTTHRPGFKQERGILITVGDPAEIPIRGQIVPANQKAYFTLRPIAYEAMPEARSIAAKYRKCIFNFEIDNTTYYTLPNTNFRHMNCLAECRRRFLFEKCGCVYALYWSVGNATECNIAQIECIANYADDIYFSRRPGTQNEQMINGEIPDIICDCTFSCNFVHYEYDVRFTQRDEKRNTKQELDFVEVDIFFNKKVMIKYNNHLIWTWLDLFVNIGGLTSLFLGCSFISGFEIIYFSLIGVLMCFKLWFNRRIGH